jgi:hypothetical protein
MKHLVWFAYVLLVAGTASAQESSAPSSAPLVLEVRAQRISHSELEAALRKELDQGKPGDAPQGQLELSDQPSNVVRLTYRDAQGHESTRDLYLPPDDPEALEKITIAAANLVRDQAAALLAELEALQAAAQPPPLPAAAAPAAAPPPEPPGYDPCQPEQLLHFGFDLVPGVGASSTPIGRDAARSFSLGLGGTLSAGTKGVELSVGINIARLGTCGVQLAAGVNTTHGPVQGAQLALVNLGTSWLKGLQAGVVNYAHGNVSGAQLSVVNLSWGRVQGTQLGVVNLARHGAQGAQLGVVNLGFGPTSAQLGVLNIAGGESKLQLGVANFVRGNATAQLGVANIATGSVPAQLGVLNIGRFDTRVQVGVINVSRSARAPVGLLNIVRDGHTSFDAWASENGTLLAGVTHGGDLVRNTYAAGTRLSKGSAQTVFAVGIGVRLWTDPRFNLDLDSMYELLANFSPFKTRTQTTRLKLDATIWLHERVGLLAGAGYALMTTQDEGVESQALFGETVFQTAREDSNGNGRAGLFGFPTFNLGVRVMLSNPKKRSR